VRGTSIVTIVPVLVSVPVRVLVLLMLAPVLVLLTVLVLVVLVLLLFNGLTADAADPRIFSFGRALGDPKMIIRRFGGSACKKVHP
jgi:hypothetical protein